MVNIHGGGFISGSGTVKGGISPKYFMEYDVVIVSFNYRLGVFGFLSTGDDAIPGNAGLKDQILALKWVQRNIAAFGGNPKRVTIVGQSAGSASVGYLLLNPQASDLYQAGIQESGSPLCPWAYQRNQVEISYKTASFIDSQFEYLKNSTKLLEVLQKTDAKELDIAALSYTQWESTQPGSAGRIELQQGFYFAPVIEVPSDNAVFTHLQYEAFKKGKFNKVPLLIGISSEEGLMNLNDNLNHTLQQFDLDSTFLNPQNLHLRNKSSKYEVGKLLKEEYSPNSSFIENRLGAIQYFTEQDFVKSIVKQAEYYSAHSDVYFYDFAYTGEMGLNIDFKLPGSGNVGHMEEYMYLFGGLDPTLYPENDQLIHDRFLKIWTNFATYQNPTPDDKDELLQNITWPKVQPESFKFVNIGNFTIPDLKVVVGKPKAKRLAFWNNIYENYGERPFDTY